MKISYGLLLIVFLATVVLNRVAADSEVSVTTQNSKGTERVDDTVEPVKKSEDVRSDSNGSSEHSKSGGRENDPNKADGKALKNKHEQNMGSESKSRKGEKEGTILPVKDKCDSSSISCMDEDKTLVACLRVPGNESSAPSILIQNKGKDPLAVTISAPHLDLDRKQISLREREDTELEVSVDGLVNGRFIILSAGHGSCRISIQNQFVQHGKPKGDDNSNYPFFNLSRPTSLLAFISFAALAAAVVLVFMCLWRKRLARRVSKYQMLDMELPVSHGSKPEPGTDEGWDNNWDVEEAPMTPSFPVTPSFSSSGMTSRKFNKEGWKD